MEALVDFEKITRLFTQAALEQRRLLYEYETYDLLRHSGAESVPAVRLLPKGIRPSNAELLALPGDTVVMKIVSPTIVHKTEVGGVKILPKQPGKIRSNWRRMMEEVAANYTDWIGKYPRMAPGAYRGLNREALHAAVAADIRGVLLCQYMPPDSQTFGNELIVSIRRTREFGMVITAGLGGTDTEVYARRFRKGAAVVSASTVLTDGESFFELFRGTIAYEKLAGLSRGQSRIVSDDQLIECFAAFIAMANHYSPTNPEAPAVIEELEVNPFAFTDYQMVPLDGMCRFAEPVPGTPSRPIAKIDRLLHPASIAIVGVSAARVNFGRIILRKIISGGFDPSRITVVRPGSETIEGVACVPDLASLTDKVDLLVVSIPAEQVPALVDQVVDLDRAASVMLIPAGFGEKKGSETRARALKAKIDQAHARTDGGPIFLGGNCLGIISHPGRYETIFIPEEKLPRRPGAHQRNTAFISQSGAFMITRLSKHPRLDPAYAVSVGNQTDLSIGDIATFLKDCEGIDVIAIYAEGFNDMDGLDLCRAIRAAVVGGKAVVFYKAGRTPEGKSATAGHTASLAGDYMVCESCVRQAGAMVADTFVEFEGLYLLATYLHGRQVAGNRLAAVSGAGFEAVGMADNIQDGDFALQMAAWGSETVAQIGKILGDAHLESLVDVKNPMDINPAADDLTHVRIVATLASDPGVDCIVVGLDPLSPAMRTLPDDARAKASGTSRNSIARLMPELIAKLEKPIVGVVDGGRLYDPVVDALEDGGMPVFRSADLAVATLAKYVNGRLHADRIRGETP